MDEVIKNLYTLFDAAWEENINGRGNNITKMVTTFIPDAIQNLQAYKDLEDQDKLVTLPCKIGDIVYQPGYKFTKCSAHKYAPQYAHDMNCEDCCSECDSECYPFIYSGRVCEIKVLSNGEVLIRVQFNEKWDNSSFTIGREVFLTLEEAIDKQKM